jgi:vancomycin resistance protein YoaR
MKKKKEITLIVFASLVVAYLIYIAFTSVVFENRFGFNSKVAGVDVSLKTKEEAEKIVAEKTRDYQARTVLVNQKTYPVSDFVKNYDLKKSIGNGLAEQNNNLAIFSIFASNNYSLSADFGQPKFSQNLIAEYKKWAVVPQDARIDIKEGKVINGSFGQRLLLTESRTKIQKDLSLMKPETGYVIKNMEPMVTDKAAAKLVEEAKKAVSEPLVLTSGDTSFEVKEDQLANWLKVTPKKPRTLVAREPLVNLEKEEFFYFDPDKVTDYVDEIKTKIDQPKVNAQLTMASGSLSVAVPEKIGYRLDVADTLEKIQNAATGGRQIELKVEQDLPEVRAENLNELGITELISTGTTDFRGSPANRIHNFRTGASKFNQVLIKPGENFSFNQTLGPVEASTGYLPELVILENKTVPQYGGGLCQVSSTAFRAALNAGLPILERRYHAYPVSYYKPYGVDATIYLPKPDLVFKNDTGHYILIQTRVSGTKLFFDFYGTKVQRNITFAGNIKGTGAVFPVENVNPGISEAGARGKGSFTASVYRFVYDASGKLTKTDTFISKYDSPDKYPH